MDANALTVATVALVPAIFGTMLPSLAEVRGQADDAGHLAAGVKAAGLTSAAAVLTVATVAGRPEVVLAGSAAVVAFVLLYRHAAEVPAWRT